MERLEERVMLSNSPEAQQFVYLLNRMRHDPAKFVSEFGLPEALAQVPARPPLAISGQLSDVAAGHALEMAQENYFQHQSPVTGKWPNQVAREAGYPLPSDWPNGANYIESIAAGTFYSSAIEPLKALLVDEGQPDLIHRRHLLGSDEFLAENREIGVGYAFDTAATYNNYWAVEIARRDVLSPFLTGVAFHDANHNGGYDAGEGLPGIVVTAGPYTTHTDAAGGWSLSVPAGVYRVQASGAGLSPTAFATVTVGEENVEVDFLAGQPYAVVNFASGDTSQPAEDVNADGHISPLDALVVINNLNAFGSRILASGAAGSPAADTHLDVNRDGSVTAQDVLQIVRYLNRANPPANGEGESSPQPFPSDSERLINSLRIRLQTTDEQSTAVAMNAQGAAVVAFSGKGPLDADGIFARRFDSLGVAQGTAFQVNTTTREGQQSPSVAMADDGSFLVAWDGRGPGDQRGIFAQWYSPSGLPVGAETRVNASPGGVQERAAAAMTGDGGSVIAWQGVGPGDVDGIFLQRFAADGQPLGAEFRVNTHTVGEQAYPALAINDAGEFVVTWSSRHQDGNDWGVYGQRFNADGSAAGAEFQVNSQVNASQYDSAVAIGPEGDFVVTWSGYEVARSGWSIFARGFEADGRSYGREIPVNTRTVGQNKDSQVAMLPGGGFVVTWTGGEPNGAGWEIYGRSYAATREAETDAFQINTVSLGYASGHQEHAAVAIGSTQFRLSRSTNSRNWSSWPPPPTLTCQRTRCGTAWTPARRRGRPLTRPAAPSPGRPPRRKDRANTRSWSGSRTTASRT